MTNLTVAQFANQRLSLQYSVCCIEEDKSCACPSLTPEGLCIPDPDPLCAASDVPTCRATPKTALPDWLLQSEYFQDPKLMYAKEGYASGLAGTNPAGWKTYGMGLPRVFHPPSAPSPEMP